jgi:hypothetical protein
MTPDRKRPTAGFSITVALLAVLVGYPLGYGPAIWLVNQRWCPGLVVSGYLVIYSPFHLLQLYGPQPVHDALDWYARLWS